MTLLIISTVSVIFVGIVTILVLQIKSSLNVSKVEQEKLLKLVEDTSELNKQLTQIVAESSKHQSDSSQVLKNQIDNLTQTTEKLDTRLIELNKANHQTKESLNQALASNNKQQQESLEALTHKLETFSAVSNQVENLTQTTEKTRNPSN
ncbi:MAG: hypothetical protein HC917_09230 [Richelia sp. SM2_1_7]|nr:hypothetical protein [Richelia sp. SM2_1_7]